MTRSMTVGIPKGRVPPLSLGISTLFTGEGVYVPSRRAALIPAQCVRAYSGNSSIGDTVNTGSPFVCLHLLPRFHAGSLCSSTCATVTRLRECPFHDVPGVGSSCRIHRLFRTHGRPPLTSTFGPSVLRPTMPSADFCLLPLYVAIQGASGFPVIALTSCS